MILEIVRLVNLALSVIAFYLILRRIKGVQGFEQKRTARYFGYAGLVFLLVAGNLESILQSSPTGVRTAIGFFVLVFVIYSEWEKPKA